VSSFPADVASAPSWWCPYPGGALAVSADVAAAWQARGRRVVLGSYADAVAAGRVPAEPAAADADTAGRQLALFATEAA
jgi:hypothetical protein